MTAGVLERPSLFGERPALDGGGRLEDLLGAALDDARAHGSTECPVCHARMTLAGGGADCGGCGSRLS